MLQARVKAFYELTDKIRDVPQQDLKVEFNPQAMVRQGKAPATTSPYCHASARLCAKQHPPLRCPCCCAAGNKVVNMRNVGYEWNGQPLIKSFTWDFVPGAETPSQRAQELRGRGPGTL